jgi:hypothetical protein
MNSPILAILVMIIIIISSTPTLMNEASKSAGSALSIMNKASEGGPQAWCAPNTLQHHYSTGCLMTLPT